jgi:NitT/TauT family transport system ATP-binding protein
MTHDALIEVRNLRVSYDGLEILHGVDITVRDGEFVTIVGKSGCGKSTLLLALAGFIKREGDVRMPSDIGMVFQNYAVFPWLTVRGNIAFGLQDLGTAERAEVIRHHLKLVGLEAHAGKYPAQLSGGQAQRVALARALAPNPPLVFMDEPFGALDMFTRDKMQEWLGEIWENEDKTVLFVTHNIEEAIFLSDRIVMMGEGDVLDELRIPFERPRTRELKFSPEFMKLKHRILERMESC